MVEARAGACGSLADADRAIAGGALNPRRRRPAPAAGRPVTPAVEVFRAALV
ncbi:hypothetical protein [Knoellia koreensis]|uniref:Uncharacterized protein n=1 Tax=Knoellia koreensis TaxID=2730921 RepID=A0A849HBR2_9MICO|nr:hypothetical protein [Knoellia sp. DB2414S]NNM45375.1 hypothetical protein [Knoellia sp. DB2414S]